jgi:putative transcriptional regulator
VAESSVREIRERLGMSQRKFAITFGLNLQTLRQWEQDRRRPDGPARVLLMLIEREPEAVQRVVGH